jgi:hypothetical protein
MNTGLGLDSAEDLSPCRSDLTGLDGDLRPNTLEQYADFYRQMVRPRSHCRLA